MADEQFQVPTSIPQDPAPLVVEPVPDPGSASDPTKFKASDFKQSTFLDEVFAINDAMVAGAANNSLLGKGLGYAASGALIADVATAKDPNYEWFNEPDIKNGKLDPAIFYDVENAQQFEARRRYVEKTRELDVLAASRPIAAFAGAMIGGAPENIAIPGAVAVKGARVGLSVARSAALSGAVGAVGNVAVEAGIQAMDSRTEAERDPAYVSSAVLGGVLGFGIGGWMARSANVKEARAFRDLEAKIQGIPADNFDTTTPSMRASKFEELGDTQVVSPQNLIIRGGKDLGAPYDAAKAGEILVWEGRLQGEEGLHVIDGSSRARAALAAGEQGVTVRVIKDASDAEAVAIGHSRNLAQGSKSIADVASFYRDEPDLRIYSDRGRVNDAVNLSLLPVKEVETLRLKGLDDDAAAIVGRQVRYLDEAQQRTYLDQINDAAQAKQSVGVTNAMAELSAAAARKGEKVPADDLVRMSRTADAVAERLAADVNLIRIATEGDMSGAGGKARAIANFAEQNRFVREELSRPGPIKEKAEFIAKELDAWRMDRETDKLSNLSAGAVTPESRDLIDVRDSIAISANGRKLELATKMAGATDFLTPDLRGISSPVPSERKFTGIMSNLGFVLDGIGPGQSIEALVRSQEISVMAKLNDSFNTIFNDMRKANAGKMTADEFAEQITLANRSNDRHDNPYVERAAREFRRMGYNPVKRNAADAGIVLNATGSPTYAMRQWDVPSIKQREAEFKTFFENHFSQQLQREYVEAQATKARFEENIDARIRELGQEPEGARSNLQDLRLKLEQLEANNPDMLAFAEATRPYREAVTDAARAVNDANALERPQAKADLAVAQQALKDFQDANGGEEMIKKLRSFDKDRAKLRGQIGTAREIALQNAEIQALRDQIADITMDPMVREKEIERLLYQINEIKKTGKTPEIQAAAEQSRSLYDQLRVANDAGDDIAKQQILTELAGFKDTDEGRALRQFRAEKRDMQERLARLSDTDENTQRAIDKLEYELEKDTARMESGYKSILDRFSSMRGSMEALEKKDAKLRKKSVEKIRREIEDVKEALYTLSDRQAIANAKLDALQYQAERRVSDVDEATRLAVRDRSQMAEAKIAEAEDAAYEIATGAGEVIENFARQAKADRSNFLKGYKSRKAEITKAVEKDQAALEAAKERLAAIAEGESTSTAKRAVNRAQKVYDKQVAWAQEQLAKLEERNKANQNKNSAGAVREREAEAAKKIEARLQNLDAVPVKQGEAVDKAIETADQRLARAQEVAQARVSAAMERHAEAEGLRLERMSKLTQQLEQRMELDLSKYDAISYETLKQLVKMEELAQDAAAASLRRIEQIVRKRVKVEGKVNEIWARETDEQRVSALQRTIEETNAKNEARRQTKIEMLEKARRDNEAEFINTWEMGYGADDGFRTYARDAANSFYDNVIGRETTFTDGAKKFMVPLEHGPLKSRSVQIDDRQISQFLINDARILMGRYVRSATADIELTRRFGSADLTDQLDEVKAEYNELRDRVSRASSDQAAREIAGLSEGWFSAINDRLGSKIMDMINRKREFVAGVKGGVPHTERERILAYLQERENTSINDMGKRRNILRGDNYQAGDEYVRAILNFTYAAKSGNFGIVNLGDLSRSVAEHGLKATWGGLASMFGNIRKVDDWRVGLDSYKRAELSEAGIALSDMMNNHVTRDMDPGLLMSKGAFGIIDKLGNAASKLNGMYFLQQLTEGVVYAAVKGRAIKAVMEGGDDWMLQKLRIGKEDVPALRNLISSYMTENEKGVRLFNFDQWAGPEGQRLAREFRAGLHAEVMNGTTKRGIGDTPWWTQTQLGRIFTQFGGYSMATHQKASIRNLQDQTGGHMAWLWGVTTGVGMLITAINMTINDGWDRASENPAWWLLQGLKNNPMLALPMMIAGRFDTMAGFDPIGKPIEWLGEQITGTDTKKNLDGDVIKNAPKKFSSSLGPFANTIDRAMWEGIPALAEAATSSEKDLTRKAYLDTKSGVPLNNMPGISHVSRLMLEPLLGIEKD